MQDIKTFRVLKINTTSDNNLGLDSILVEMSEIEKLDLNEISYKTYSAFGKLFIFLSRSSIANRILNSPESHIEFDMEEFNEEFVQVSNKSERVLIHIEYLKEKRKILSLRNKMDSTLSDYIEECLLTHHLDMYFLVLFRSVLYSEYDSNTRAVADMNEVYFRYKKLCAYLLFEICGIRVEEYGQLTNSDFDNYKRNYDRELKYGQEYIRYFRPYVEFYQNLKLFLNSNFKEELPTYILFFQNCMIQGYKDANYRLTDNLFSKEQFGLTTIYTDDSEVLKIYLTPFSFLNMNKISEWSKSGELEKQLDVYLETKNISRILDEALSQELETEYIYRNDDEDILYYYKLRQIDADYIEFGEQNRKSAMHSLVIKGQINLTKL